MVASLLLFENSGGSESLVCGYGPVFVIFLRGDREDTQAVMATAPSYFFFREDVRFEAPCAYPVLVSFGSRSFV